MSTFKVSDMTCGHCEKSIKDELSKQDPQVLVKVDLKAKTVDVKNLSDDKVLLALQEIGFTPEKME